MKSSKTNYFRESETLAGYKGHRYAERIVFIDSARNCPLLSDSMPFHL